MRPPPPPLSKRPTARVRAPLKTLCLLTLAVLAVHWALLSDAVMPVAPHTNLQASAGQAFSTRMVTRPPPAPPAPKPAPPKPKPRPKPKPQPTPITAPPAAIAPVEVSPVAIAPPSSDPIPTDADGTDAAQADDTNMQEAPPIAPSPQDAASAAPAAPPAPPPPPAQLATQFQYPAPVLLKYDVRGKQRSFPYAVNGELQWAHDATSYNARLTISHFLLGSRVQTSTGSLTPLGLEPMRFGDKFRSEVAAHFERDKGKVTFSANTPDVPLTDGMQDQLSVFFQIASMFAGAPNNYPAGTTLAFQAIGPRSLANWTFTVGDVEKLTLPGGEVSALRLWRDPTGPYEPKGEIWLAPNMDYLPVRIRLSKSEDEYSDMQWSETEKP